MPSSSLFDIVCRDGVLMPLPGARVYYHPGKTPASLDLAAYLRAWDAVVLDDRTSVVVPEAALDRTTTRQALGRTLGLLDRPDELAFVPVPGDPIDPVLWHDLAGLAGIEAVLPESPEPEHPWTVPRSRAATISELDTLFRGVLSDGVRRAESTGDRTLAECLALVRDLTGRLFPDSRFPHGVRVPRTREEGALGSVAERWLGDREDFTRIGGWQDLNDRLSAAGPRSAAVVLVDRPHTAFGHVYLAYHAFGGQIAWTNLVDPDGMIRTGAAPFGHDSATYARAVVIDPNGVVLRPAGVPPESTSDVAALLDKPVSRGYRGGTQQAGRERQVSPEVLVGLRPVGAPQDTSVRAAAIAVTGLPGADMRLHLVHQDGSVEHSGRIGAPDVFVGVSTVQTEAGPRAGYQPLTPTGRTPTTGIAADRLEETGAETVATRPIAAAPGHHGRGVLADAVTERLGTLLSPDEVAWEGWRPEGGTNSASLATWLDTGELAGYVQDLLDDDLRFVPGGEDVPEALADVSIVVQARRVGTYRPELVTARNVGYGGRLELGVRIEGLGEPVWIGPLGVWEQVMLQNPPALLPTLEGASGTDGDTAVLDPAVWTSGQAVVGALSQTVLTRMGVRRQREAQRFLTGRLADAESRPAFRLRVGSAFVMVRIGGQYRAVVRGDLEVTLTDGTVMKTDGAVEVLLDVATAVRVLVPLRSVPTAPPGYDHRESAPAPDGVDPGRWQRLRDDAEIALTPARLSALQHQPGAEDLSAAALVDWIQVIDRVPDDVAVAAARIGLAVSGPLLRIAFDLKLDPGLLVVFGPHLRALAVSGTLRAADLLERLRPSGVRTYSDIAWLAEVAGRLRLTETDLAALLTFTAEQVAPELLATLRDADLRAAMDAARLRVRMSSSADLGASELGLRSAAEVTALATGLGVAPAYLAGVAAWVRLAVGELGSPYEGAEADEYEERIGQEHRWRRYVAGVPGPWQAWPEPAEGATETEAEQMRAAAQLLSDELAAQYRRWSTRIVDQLVTIMRRAGVLAPALAGPDAAEQSRRDVGAARRIVRLAGRLGVEPGALAGLLPSRHAELLLHEFFGDVALMMTADHTRKLAGFSPPAPSDRVISAADRAWWLAELGVDEATFDRLLDTPWGDPFAIRSTAIRAGLHRSDLRTLTELSLRIGCVPVHLPWAALLRGLDPAKMLRVATRIQGGVDPVHLLPFAALLGDVQDDPDALAAALTETATRISLVLDDRMRLPWTFRQVFRWMHGHGGAWIDTAHMTEWLPRIAIPSADRYSELLEGLDQQRNNLRLALRSAAAQSSSGPDLRMLKELSDWSADVFDLVFVGEFYPLISHLGSWKGDGPDRLLKRSARILRALDDVHPRPEARKRVDAARELHLKAGSALQSARARLASVGKDAAVARQGVLIRVTVDYTLEVVGYANEYLRSDQVPPSVRGLYRSAADRLSDFAVEFRAAMAEHPAHRVVDRLSDSDILVALGNAATASGRAALSPAGIDVLADSWIAEQWAERLSVRADDLRADFRERPWFSPRLLAGLKDENGQPIPGLHALAIRIHRVPTDLPALSEASGMPINLIAGLAGRRSVDPSVVSIVFGYDSDENVPTMDQLTREIDDAAAADGTDATTYLEGLALAGFRWRDRSVAPPWDSAEVLPLWMGIDPASLPARMPKRWPEFWRTALEELADVFQLDRHQIADLAARLRVPAIWVMSYAVRIGDVPSGLLKDAERLGVHADLLFAFAARLSVDTAVLTRDDHFLAGLAPQDGDGLSRFGSVQRVIAHLPAGTADTLRQRPRPGRAAADLLDPMPLPVPTEALWTVTLVRGAVPEALTQRFAETSIPPRLLLSTAAAHRTSMSNVVLAHQYMPFEDKGHDVIARGRFDGYPGWVRRLAEHAHLTEAELAWANQVLLEHRDRGDLRKLLAMEPRAARQLMLGVRLARGRLTTDALTALAKSYPDDATDMLRTALDGTFLTHEYVPLLTDVPIPAGDVLLLKASGDPDKVRARLDVEAPAAGLDGTDVSIPLTGLTDGWASLNRIVWESHQDGKVSRPRTALVALKTGFGQDRQAYFRLAQIFYATLPVLRRMGLLAPSGPSLTWPGTGWTTPGEFFDFHSNPQRVLQLIEGTGMAVLYLDAVTVPQIQAAVTIFDVFVTAARTRAGISDLDRWALQAADAGRDESVPLRRRNEKDIQWILPLIADPVARWQVAALFQVVDWPWGRTTGGQPGNVEFIEVQPPTGMGPILDQTEPPSYAWQDPELGAPAGSTPQQLVEWLSARVRSGLHPVPHTGDRQTPLGRPLMLSMKVEFPVLRTANSWTAVSAAARARQINERLRELGATGSLHSLTGTWRLTSADLGRSRHPWRELAELLHLVKRFGAQPVDGSMTVQIGNVTAQTASAVRALMEMHRDVIDRLLTDPADGWVRSRAGRLAALSHRGLGISGLDPVLDLPVLQVQIKTLLGLVAAAERDFTGIAEATAVRHPSEAGQPLDNRWRGYAFPGDRENRLLNILFKTPEDRWQAGALWVLAPWHPGDDHAGLPYGLSVAEATLLGLSRWGQEPAGVLRWEHPAFAMTALPAGVFGLPVSELPARFPREVVERARATYLLAYPGDGELAVRHRASVARAAWADVTGSRRPAGWWQAWYSELGMFPGTGEERHLPVVRAQDRAVAGWVSRLLDADPGAEVLRDLDRWLAAHGGDEAARQQRREVRERLRPAVQPAGPPAGLRSIRVDTRRDPLLVSVFRSGLAQGVLPPDVGRSGAKTFDVVKSYVIEALRGSPGRFERMAGRTLGELLAEALPVGVLTALDPGFRLSVPERADDGGAALELALANERLRLRSEVAAAFDRGNPVLIDLLHRVLGDDDELLTDGLIRAVKELLDGEPAGLPTRTAVLTTLIDHYSPDGSVAVPELLWTVSLALNTTVVVAEDGLRTAYGPGGGSTLHVERDPVDGFRMLADPRRLLAEAAAVPALWDGTATDCVDRVELLLILLDVPLLHVATTDTISLDLLGARLGGRFQKPTRGAALIALPIGTVTPVWIVERAHMVLVHRYDETNYTLIETQANGADRVQPFTLSRRGDGLPAALAGTVRLLGNEDAAVLGVDFVDKRIIAGPSGSAAPPADRTVEALLDGGGRPGMMRRPSPPSPRQQADDVTLPSGRTPTGVLPAAELTGPGVRTVELHPIAIEPGRDGRDAVSDAVTAWRRMLPDADAASWDGWRIEGRAGAGVPISELLGTDTLRENVSALLDGGLRIVPAGDASRPVPPMLRDVSLTVTASRAGEYRPESLDGRQIRYEGRLAVVVRVDGLATPAQVGPIGLWERAIVPAPSAMLPGIPALPGQSGLAQPVDAGAWADGRAMIGQVTAAARRWLADLGVQGNAREFIARGLTDSARFRIGLSGVAPVGTVRIGNQSRVVVRGDLVIQPQPRGPISTYPNAVEVLLDPVTAGQVPGWLPPAPPAYAPATADDARRRRLQDDVAIALTPARLESLIHLLGAGVPSPERVVRWIEVIGRVPDDAAAARIGLVVPGPLLRLAAELLVDPEWLVVFGSHLRALASAGTTRPLDLLGRLRSSGVRTVGDIVWLAEVAGRLELGETDLPALLTFPGQRVAPELLATLRDDDLVTAMDTARMRVVIMSSPDLGAHGLGLRHRDEVTALATALGVKPVHLAGIAPRIRQAFAALGSSYSGGQPDRATRIAAEITASLLADGLVVPVYPGIADRTDAEAVREVMEVTGRLGVHPGALAALLPSRRMELLLHEFLADIPLAAIAGYVRKLIDSAPPAYRPATTEAERARWSDELGVAATTIEELLSVPWGDPERILTAASRAGLDRLDRATLTRLSLQIGWIPVDLGRTSVRRGVEPATVLQVAAQIEGGVEPNHLMPFQNLMNRFVAPAGRGTRTMTAAVLARQLAHTARFHVPLLDERMQLPWVFRQMFRWMHAQGGDWIDTGILPRQLADLPGLTVERYTQLRSGLEERERLVREATELALSSSIEPPGLRPLMEETTAWLARIRTDFEADLGSRAGDAGPRDYDRSAELGRQRSRVDLEERVTRAAGAAGAPVPLAAVERLHAAEEKRQQAIDTFASAYGGPESSHGLHTWGLQASMIQRDLAFAEALAAYTGQVLRSLSASPEVAAVADAVIGLVADYRAAKAFHPANRTVDNLTDGEIGEMLGSASPAPGRELLSDREVGLLADSWRAGAWSEMLKDVTLEDIMNDVRERPWLSPSSLMWLTTTTGLPAARMRAFAIRHDRIPEDLPLIARDIRIEGSAGPVPPAMVVGLATRLGIDPQLVRVLDLVPGAGTVVDVAAVERMVGEAAGAAGTDVATYLESLAVSGYRWSTRNLAPRWNSAGVLLSTWTGVGPEILAAGHSLRLEHWRRLLDDLAELFRLDRHAISVLAARLRVPTSWMLSLSVRIGRVPVELPQIADRLNVRADLLFAFAAGLPVDPLVLTPADGIAALRRRVPGPRFASATSAIEALSEEHREALRRRPSPGRLSAWDKLVPAGGAEPASPRSLPPITESLWRIAVATEAVPADLDTIFTSSNADPRDLIQIAEQLRMPVGVVALAEQFMSTADAGSRGDARERLIAGYQPWVDRMHAHAHITEKEFVWANDQLRAHNRGNLGTLGRQTPRAARQLMLQVRLESGRLTGSALWALARDHPGEATEMLRTAVGDRTFTHRLTPSMSAGLPIPVGVEVLLPARPDLTTLIEAEAPGARSWAEFTVLPLRKNWTSFRRILRQMIDKETRSVPSAAIRVHTSFGRDTGAYLRLAQLFYASLPVLHRMGLLAPAGPGEATVTPGWTTFADFAADHADRDRMMQVENAGRRSGGTVIFHLGAVTPAQLQVGATVFAGFVEAAREPGTVEDLDSWEFAEAGSYAAGSVALHRRYEDTGLRVFDLITDPVARLQAFTLFQVADWAPGTSATGLVEVRPPVGMGPVAGQDSAQAGGWQTPRRNRPSADTAGAVEEWLRERVESGLHPVPHTGDETDRLNRPLTVSAELTFPIRRTANPWTAVPARERAARIVADVGALFPGVLHESSDGRWWLTLQDLNGAEKPWQQLAAVLDALAYAGAEPVRGSMSVRVGAVGERTFDVLRSLMTGYEDVLHRLSTDPAEDRVRSRAARTVDRRPDGELRFEGLDLARDLPVLQTQLKTLLGLVRAAGRDFTVEPADAHQPGSGRELGGRWRTFDPPDERTKRFLDQLFQGADDLWQARALFVTTPWHAGDDHAGLPYGLSAAEAETLVRSAPWPDDIRKLIMGEHPAFAMAALRDGPAGPASDAATLLPARFLDGLVARARLVHQLAYPGGGGRELESRAWIAEHAWAEPARSHRSAAWWATWYAERGDTPSTEGISRTIPVSGDGDPDITGWVADLLSTDPGLDVLRDLERQLAGQDQDEPVRRQRAAVRHRIAEVTGSLTPSAVPPPDLMPVDARPDDEMLESVVRAARTLNLLPAAMTDEDRASTRAATQYVIRIMREEPRRFRDMPGRTVGALLAQALPVGALLALQPGFRPMEPNPAEFARWAGTAGDAAASERWAEEERVRLRRDVAARLDQGDPFLIDLLGRAVAVRIRDDTDAVPDDTDAVLDEIDAVLDEIDAVLDEIDAVLDEIDAVLDDTVAVLDDTVAVPDDTVAVPDDTVAVPDDTDAVLAALTDHLEANPATLPSLPELMADVLETWVPDNSVAEPELLWAIAAALNIRIVLSEEGLRTAYGPETGRTLHLERGPAGNVRVMLPGMSESGSDQDVTADPDDPPADETGDLWVSPVLETPQPAMDSILAPGPASLSDVLFAAKMAGPGVAELSRIDPVAGRMWAEAMESLRQLAELPEREASVLLLDPGFGEAIRRVARLVPDETHAVVRPLLALDGALRAGVFPGGWWPAPMPVLVLGSWSSQQQPGDVLGKVRARAVLADRPVIVVDLAGAQGVVDAVLGELSEALVWYRRIGPVPLVVVGRATGYGQRLFGELRARHGLVSLAVEAAGSGDAWRLRDVNGGTVGDLEGEPSVGVFERARMLSRGAAARLPVALVEWLRTWDPDSAEAYHRRNVERLRDPAVLTALRELAGASSGDARLAVFRTALELAREFGGVGPEEGPRPVALTMLDVEPAWSEARGRVPAVFVYDFVRVTGDRQVRFPWDGLLFQMMVAGVLSGVQVVSLLRATAVTGKDRASVTMMEAVVELLSLPRDRGVLDADPLVDPRLKPIFDRIGKITKGVDGSYEGCLDPYDRVAWTGRLTALKDGLARGDEAAQMHAKLIDTVTYAVSNC